MGVRATASSHSSMWFYFSLVWAQWWIFWSIREPQTERGRGWKWNPRLVLWNPRLAGMHMLGAHGLGCHQDPQPCGYSPVWRIGLHPRQEWRLHSPPLQHPIRFAERWAGERFVGIPERRVAVVQYTITTRVDGDVLKVFWSYCSEVGFVKVPRNNKRCIWVRGFLLAYIPI